MAMHRKRSQPNSDYRKRETLVSKPYENNGEKYCKLNTDKVIPAMKKTLTENSSATNILVQHGNAPPHRNVDQSTLLSFEAISDILSISFMF